MLLMYIDVSLEPVSDPFLSLELRDRGLQWIQLRSAAGAGGFQPMVCHQIFCQLQLFELFSRLGTNPFPSSLVSFLIYTSWGPQLYKLNPVIVVRSCYIRDKPQLATLRDIVNLAFEGRLTVVVFIGVSFWKRQLNWACHTMESPNQAGFRGSQQTRFQSGLNIKATPPKKSRKVVYHYF